MNWLVEFKQIFVVITFGHNEELISFGDLGLIFKVTVGPKLPNLSQKMLLMNQISGF